MIPVDRSFMTRIRTGTDRSPPARYIGRGLSTNLSTCCALVRSGRTACPNLRGPARESGDRPRPCLPWWQLTAKLESDIGATCRWFAAEASEDQVQGKTGRNLSVSCSHDNAAIPEPPGPELLSSSVSVAIGGRRWGAFAVVATTSQVGVRYRRNLSLVCRRGKRGPSSGQNGAQPVR